VKKIQQRETRSQATAYRWPAVLFSLPFVGIGSWLTLGGFEFVPLGGKAHAPLWVIGCCGLAFLLAGLIVLFRGLLGVWNQRRIARLGERRQSEPWLADYPWDRRGLRDRPGGRVALAFFFFVFMAVFLVPFNWWAWWSGEGPWMVRIVVGLFDGVTLLVAGGFVYQLGQLLKFGRSRLAFRRFPYHPGETLSVGFSGTRLDHLKATLRFVEERFETTGSGKNRSTRLVSYTHFDDQRELTAPPGHPEIEIVFEIPDNPEWVTELSAKPVRYWELLIESEQPGIDFKTTFPLPVYTR